jgi:hypothetical protein
LALPRALTRWRLAALAARFFAVFLAFLRFGAAFFAAFFAGFFAGAAGMLTGAGAGMLTPIGAGLSTGDAGVGVAAMPGSVGCGCDCGCDCPPSDSGGFGKVFIRPLPFRWPTLQAAPQ